MRQVWLGICGIDQSPLKPGGTQESPEGSVRVQSLIQQVWGGPGTLHFSQAAR